MPSLYISDLHLQNDQPALTELALALFDSCPGQFSELFILGDLFEYWIGDDAADDCAMQVSESLSRIGNSGVSVKLMHGNRDFLLGDQFVQQCNATLIDTDSFRQGSADSAMILLHGDTLCTDDSDYQMYRRMVRNRHWQQEFLSRTVSERLATARAMRDTSAARGRNAANQSITDVHADAVTALFNQTKSSRILHGHTHRPGIHTLTVDSRPVERMVLGDWSKKGAVVAVSDGDDCRLVFWNGHDFSAYPAA